MLAALLRRHAGAIVLGERTWGKDYVLRVEAIDPDWRALIPDGQIEVPGECWPAACCPTARSHRSSPRASAPGSSGKAQPKRMRPHKYGERPAWRAAPRDRQCSLAPSTFILTRQTSFLPASVMYK